MKKIIKALIPINIRIKIWKFIHFFNLLKLYIFDLIHYVKYSSTFFNLDSNLFAVESRITSLYHTIEKGLSFDNIKYNFGYDNIKELDYLLEILLKHNLSNKDSVAFESAMAALYEYKMLHNNNNITMDIDIANIIKKYETYMKHEYSSTYNVSNDILENIKELNFQDFSNSRHSVRSFSDKKVNINDIIDAIKISINAPSVCNRQTSKCYIVEDEEIKIDVLEMQRGNKGFSNIDKLIVITSLTNSFYGINERFQGFIDSGIYAMNLIYSLHFKGIATCPLCWCHSIAETNHIKLKLKIPNSERIIGIVAIGKYKTQYTATASSKNSIDKYYKIIAKDKA